MTGPHRAEPQGAPVPVVPATPVAGSGRGGPAGLRPQGAGQEGQAKVFAAAVVIVVLAGLALFLAGLSLGGLPGGAGRADRAALQAFMESYERISRQFVGEVEPDELIEAAIDGMFESLDDPYSAYMSADEFDVDLADINGEFEGIGARMTAEDAEGQACSPLGADCALRVVDVLTAAPAEAAGLRAADVVVTIDAMPVMGLTMDDAIALIRGPRGSEVVLGVHRDDLARDVTITRDTIKTEDVRSAVLADGQVGYLRVDGFSSRAADDFRAQLTEHLETGMKRIVVDVRADPGGFVDAAVAMASQFIASGPVFWEEDASGSQRAVEVTGGGLATDPDVRVVVLVDGGSASASEMLASALRDSGRATIVGETTFGKGTIQEWTQLPGDNGGFRLSIARWLTPAKTRVDGTGIVPDIIIERGGERFEPGRDDPDVLADAQLQAAVDHLMVGFSAGPANSLEEIAPATPRPSARSSDAPSGAPTSPG